jgi:hypothetical protein
VERLFLTEKPHLFPLLQPRTTEISSDGKSASVGVTNPTPFVKTVGHAATDRSRARNLEDYPPEGQLAICDLSDQKKSAGGKWLCGKVAKKVPDQFQYKLWLFAMWSMPNL